MNVGVKAIDKLKLSEAFSKGTYKKFNDCWTFRMDKTLMVIDDNDEKISKFSDNEDDEPNALLIINEENKEIVLLSIDNKLIKSYPGGITDCAVFDEEQFRFVEFKTNAYGNSEEAIRDTFDKAVSQLKNSLELFTERLNNVNINFLDSTDIKCHIVTSETFPKSKATKQEYKYSFADETGIELNFEHKTYWNK